MLKILDFYPLTRIIEQLLTHKEGPAKFRRSSYFKQ